MRKKQDLKIFRFSFNQERLWFIDQLEGSIHYHIPAALRLKGQLNKVALEQAIRQLINRHEVLRTVMLEEDGKARQHVLAEYLWHLQVTDLTHQQQDSLHDDIRELVMKPFNLATDHMLRANLILLDTEVSVLVLTMHHIAADGWSVSILVNELAACYEAFTSGKLLELPELAIQYADFAIWQREQMTPVILDQQLTYWKKQLSGTEPLQLPADFQRPALQSKNAARYAFVIKPEILEQLHLLSRQQDATLFMTLLAVFKVLLSRYSGQEDICVGTSIAGRVQQETENLIGFFVNTLALRSHTDMNVSFKTFIQQVRETTLDAYENQELPFEKVVEAVVKERDLSRTPLFQVMFELHNTPEMPELILGEVIVAQEDIDAVTAQFDMTVNMLESNGELNGYITYCTDLYSEATIERLSVHFETLLNAVIASPDSLLGQFSMLTLAEEQQLLNVFNDTETVYPHEQTAIGIFEAQVLRYPSSPALVFENQIYTYQELDERSNQLAGYLRSKGVVTDVLVPVCLERSAEMAVAILGVLKAGGAYVPVDPGYPEERISFMLEDTNASVVVTTSDLKTSIGAFASIDAILLDTDVEEINKWAITPPLNPAAPGDLAYVIYTSGSTGKPKGVMVEHAGMLNHLYAKINDLQLTAETVVAFTASYTFDISVWQLFSALLCGGKTVIYSSERILEPAMLIDAVETDGITILELVPSYLNAVLQENTLAHLNQLSYLLVTGEAVSQPLLAQWFAHPHYGRIPVVNAYGPTEASDDICHHIMYETPSRISVPVGKPVQNMRIYVLSAGDQLCPVGVPGEICVSGIGVSRGYLNRPDLTASRFVDTPFESSGKMYRTGDLGRWLPDGTVEYLGRIDDQVKIRGFRIELGEIENVLQQNDAIVQAAVIVKTDESGNKRLVAYVVAEGVFDREATVSWLKNHLPEYMVPGLFVALDELPLTGNGKIDRKGLPDPDMGSLQTGTYTAPRNEQEIVLAGIWQDLLHIPKVGIYDNFFELGGDSIITIQVVSRVRRAGFSLHPRDLFIHQTIAGLSACMAAEAASASSGEQGLLEGESGLLPIQQHYFESGSKELSHYNQSVFLSIDKSITSSRLNEIIGQLVAAHDALRFTYEYTGEGWRQVYGMSAGSLEINDLRSLKSSELAQTIAAHNDRYQASLDILKGTLLRAVLILTPDTTPQNRLLLVVHHLAVDGVSWRILLEDFEQLLTQKALPQFKTASYRQWHQALLNYSTKKNSVQQQRGYWENVVASAKPMRTVHTWPGTITGAEIKQHTTKLDALHTRQLLQDVPRAYHTVINDLLLTALAQTLASWNKHSTIVVGLEGHGREDFIRVLTSAVPLAVHQFIPRDAVCCSGCRCWFTAETC
ncbi:amino acid adenylation domain-containing protein [Pedobacter sp. NJ-S-72]